MEHTKQQLKLILQKTNGICRICRGTEGPKLNLSSYGNTEGPEGWEVEHLGAKALKGEDNPNNWWPVHIKCNSQKGMKKTRKVRKNHSSIPQAHLVPEQDLNLERMAAEIRGRAGL
jgi:hypothetical protein